MDASALYHEVHTKKGSNRMTLVYPTQCAIIPNARQGLFLSVYSTIPYRDPSCNMPMGIHMQVPNTTRVYANVTKRGFRCHS